MSGVLALLFRVIGEGRIAHSRMAISGDGIQGVADDGQEGIYGRDDYGDGVS